MRLSSISDTLLILVHPECIYESGASWNNKHTYSTPSLPFDYIQLLKRECAAYQHILWIKFYSPQYYTRELPGVEEALSSVSTYIMERPGRNIFNPDEFELIMIKCLENGINKIDIGGGYDGLCIKVIVDNIEKALKEYKMDL